MAPAPQDNSQAEGNVAQGNSAATSNALEDNPVNIGSASLSKGRKRRRASSGSGQVKLGSFSNARGPKAAGVARRAKGKQAQKAGSWGSNPSPPEEESEKSSQDGEDLKAESRMYMFTRVPVQHFAEDIRSSRHRR